MKKGCKFKKSIALLIILVMGVSTSTTTVFGATVNKPTVTAKSAIVMERDSGEIIYSRNMHVKRDPVSTTKLLTALVVMENLSLNKVVKVSKNAANKAGSSMGLVAGEKITVRDLMYGALLPSGNDAAVALAEATAGSVSKFTVLMNKKAKELGCVDSHFVNAQGWKVSTHYSSAYDMAIIAKAAISNSVIGVICGSERYRTHKTNKQKARTIYTSNMFIAGKVFTKCGVFAGKTGTWDYNNAALVSACERDGKVLFAVVLKDTMGDRYKDTNKILNYGYKKIV